MINGYIIYNYMLSRLRAFEDIEKIPKKDFEIINKNMDNIISDGLFPSDNDINLLSDVQSKILLKVFLELYKDIVSETKNFKEYQEKEEQAIKKFIEKDKIAQLTKIFLEHIDEIAQITKIFTEHIDEIAQIAKVLAEFQDKEAQIAKILAELQDDKILEKAVDEILECQEKAEKIRAEKTRIAEQIKIAEQFSNLWTFKDGVLTINDPN
jgi:truncated hemoglobin YjbI